MKSKQAPKSFLVPRSIGQTQGALATWGDQGQLTMFTENIPPGHWVFLASLFALTDKDNPDEMQYRKMADILRVADEPDNRVAKKGAELVEQAAFPTWKYDMAVKTGRDLRDKSSPFFVREPSGFTKDGRRKWKSGIVFLAPLQEFGLFREDEEGIPVNVEESEAGTATPDAIPATDAEGNVLRDKDGNPRRLPATMVGWRISSRLAKLLKEKKTSWVFYREATRKLRMYVRKPLSFGLMRETLFWLGRSPQIEMAEATIIKRLGIGSKHPGRVRDAIDAAFADMLAEGFIDKPVVVIEKGHYKPTKSGKPRRKGRSYRWRRSKKWEPGEDNQAIEGASYEVTESRETNSHQDGDQA